MEKMLLGQFVNGTSPGGGPIAVGALRKTQIQIKSNSIEDNTATASGYTFG